MDISTRLIAAITHKTGSRAAQGSQTNIQHAQKPVFYIVPWILFSNSEEGLTFSLFSQAGNLNPAPGFKENNDFIYSGLFYFLSLHCPPIPPPFPTRGPSDDHGCGVRISSVREYRKYMNTLLKLPHPTASLPINTALKSLGQVVRSQLSSFRVSYYLGSSLNSNENRLLMSLLCQSPDPTRYDQFIR